MAKFSWKKALLMGTSLVATAAIAIGGTLAYLTSEDSDVNVMTLGNVKIEQHEAQRVEENGEFGSTLEDYEQGKILLPVTYPGNRTDDTVTIGDHEIVLSDKEANYVDKIIYVENTGKNDAYVRTLVAVPTGGADWEPAPVAANNCWLHWNVPKAYGTYWTLNATPTFVEINERGYYIWEFVHKEALVAGEISYPCVRGFYMDQKVDNDENGFYMTYADGTTKRIDDFTSEDTVDILVVSQAVQADGFEDAQAALDAAFGDITEDNHPWEVVPEEVSTFEELKVALAAKKNVKLMADIVGNGETIVIPGGNTTTLDLNGYTLLNKVVGAPAIENYGDLTVTDGIGSGEIVNGNDTVKASHTIVNKGNLTVEGGNIGSFETAGAAVVNYGTATINGGNFASKQEKKKADGLCAYAFINQSGTLTVNNAALDGRTHGLFGANGGEVIVNGGTYFMDGNGGLGCYVVYAGGDAVVTLNGGTVYYNDLRHGRHYYVYANGKNYFNEEAVTTGKIVENGIVLVEAESTAADANAALKGTGDVVLKGCNDADAVIEIPETYKGTLILDNCTIDSIVAEATANIVIKGDVVVKATSGSAITGKNINISGEGNLTAIAADEKGAFGIGGMTTETITIKDVTIKEARGGFDEQIGTDTKYYKDAPEGGAAIGSGKDGAKITLTNVHIEKAIGGSKSAGIGARYWTGVTINITNSTIDYVEGGATAAGIGGSRVSGDATESGTTINITNSTITAKGGVYGAGIGSGYDTHCGSKQPVCTINIEGSTIDATGGQYAAGVGTGYHNAALAGEIKNSTITAVSGAKVYKDTYTSAQDIGFGVVDPAREGQQTDSKLTYNGVAITIPKVNP